MNINNSKCRKQSWNLSLPFEVERLMQLEKEFMHEGELPGLFKHKRAVYERISNALSEELISELIDYSDTNSRIVELMQKFFYKKGFIDCSAIMRFLFRCKDNIKLNIRIT